MNCSLCDAAGCVPLLNDGRRSFFFCKSCELLFVPADDHISLDDEIKRYDLHDNGFSDNGYVRFLEEIVKVVEDLDPAGLRILDFGCGRNAVLSGLLQRKGFACDFYDPLYALGTRCLSEKYDIVVLCEVVEHLRNLKDEARIINNLLRQNGKVIVRTNPYPSREEFRTWWYKEDLTHINFFSRKSVDVFAMKIGCDRVDQQQKDIFILSNCRQKVIGI